VQVGGVAGANIISGTLENNVALNQTITVNSNHYGRVIGLNMSMVDLTNNYAWGLMTVNGEPVTTDTGADTTHGADVGASVKTLAWWTADDRWNSTAPAFAWTFKDTDPSSPWTWNNNAMPSLHGEEIAWPVYLVDMAFIDISGGEQNIGYITLQGALASITTAGTYTIRVAADQELAGHSETDTTRENFLNVSGTNITLIAADTNKPVTIQLSSNGRIFTVASGVTLTLETGITLQGRNESNGGNNNAPVVSITSGGVLNMKNGSAITGNTNTTTLSTNTSGGVNISMNGTFNMDGGIISGNRSTANSGVGGVSVANPSNFTMNSGTISDNHATGTNSGGGVRTMGTFIMNDGTISGNSTTGTTSSNGGGVFVASLTFTMNGGTISGNTARDGGGVYVTGTGSTFTMNDGIISGNTASNSGGGVFVSTATTFRMSGGIIYGFNEETEALRNRVTGGALTASIYAPGAGIGQYGIFDDTGAWTSRGTLASRNETARVDNGQLYNTPQ
jgi:hypothetical protein